jgi:hypothetical protein
MQPFGESVQNGHAKSLPPASDRRIGAEAPHWQGFFRLRSGQPKPRCSVVVVDPVMLARCRSFHLFSNGNGFHFAHVDAERLLKPISATINIAFA